MGAHIGHVALRVTDLDAAVAYAQRTLGLRVTARSVGQVLLSASEKHHELQLISAGEAGLDHIGIEVEGRTELDGIRDRALAAGATVLADTDSDGLGPALRILGPAGIVHEVYDGMQREPLTTDMFLRPLVRKLGHLTFFCEDPAAVVAFWVDVLGARISDEFDGITWTRLDADHHGLAVGPRERGNVLHHHAWAVQDWGALGQYCDALAAEDLALYWGPVRHGPGANLAVYLPDAECGVIEVYTDLLQIHDDRAYEPIDWSTVPRAINLWGPPPGDDLLTAGFPVLAPAHEEVSS